MRRSLTTLLAGFLVAVLVATGLAVVVGLPLSGRDAGAAPSTEFLAMLPRIAAFSIIPAAAAIWLGEMRRIRGIPFWAVAGVAIAFAGWGSMAAAGGDAREDLRSVVAFLEFASIGLAAGCGYWWLAGRRSGELAVAFEGASTLAPGAAGDRRCRMCTSVTLLLGLVPLALVSWSAIYSPRPNLVERLTERAEADVRTRLAAAGLASLSFRIEGDVGIVLGKAPSGATAAASFQKTEEVLAPLVGMPGVVGRLENRIDNDNGTAEQH